MRFLRRYKTLVASAVLSGSILLSGCHSAFISTTIINRSGQPIRLVEVDYPSASFGTGQLAEGAIFRYRFKVLGSGSASLSWIDAAGKEHTSTGPTLNEGQEGQLAVNVGPATATWQFTPGH